MNKIALFADGRVGLECVKFLLPKYIDDISYIVVTNKKSIVYQNLQKIFFDKKRILFNQNIVNSQLESVDYIFLLWWPHLIKESVIKTAKNGVINTHPSLLPYNRGKNYNFWNLIEDVPFGVSLHFVSHGIDDGDIIFQKEISKTWEDNGESLYCKAQSEMIKLFKRRYIKILKSDFFRKTQDLTKGSYHNSKELEPYSEIFLDKRYLAKDFLNVLRAKTFPPYEGCYFYEDNCKYEIQIKIKKVKE